MARWIEKKQLLSLPPHKPPKRRTSGSERFAVTASVHELQQYSILMVTLWEGSHRESQPYLTVYIDSEAQRDLTYLHGSEKWSTGDLEYNTGCSGAYTLSKAYVPPAAFDAIAGYTGDRYTSALSQVQRLMCTNRRTSWTRKKERERAFYDHLLEQRKPLPAGLMRWVENVVFDDRRYIIYRREKDTLIGRCTSCGKIVSIPRKKGMRPFTQTWCPACSKKAILVTPQNFKYQYKGFGRRFNLINRIDDGLIVRHFQVERLVHFDTGEASTEIVQENAIHFIPFDPCGKDIEIEYAYRPSRYNEARRLDWVLAGRNNWSYVPCFTPAKTFPGNVKKELEDTPWKYCATECFAKAGLAADGADISNYLHEAAVRPLIERLMRVGLYALALNTRNIEKYDSRPNAPLHQVLGVRREDLKLFRRYNVDPPEAKLYAYALRSGCTDPGKLIRTVRKYTAKEHSSSAGTVKILRDLRQNGLSWHDVERLLYVYWPQQREKLGHNRYSYFLSDYRDYIAQCRLLGRDLRDTSNMWPEDLARRHDQLVDIVKAEKNAIIDSAIRKRWEEEHALYDYAADGYVVQLPHTQAEIIAEGKSMCHCVGTYTERVAKGSTTILFVRRAAQPDVSLATAEVCGGTCVQIRAARNADPDADTMAFWNSYMRKIIEPMYKKEAAI